MRAIVTGATAGIGEATARLLVEHGWEVVGIGRRRDRLDELRATLGPRFEPLELDISDRAAIEDTPDDLWQCDVLVNNAGLAKGVEPVGEADLDDWDAMVSTNVNGLFYTTRKVLPHMLRLGSGHIVNLGSVAGRWVYPGGAVYCATKHAVRAFSEGIRLDVQGTGIRVTNIEPGLVETEFSIVRFDGDRGRASQVYQDTRPLTPRDVAETIHWCIDRPLHVNVQELVLYPTDQAAVRDVYRRSQ